MNPSLPPAQALLRMLRTPVWVLRPVAAWVALICALGCARGQPPPPPVKPAPIVLDYGNGWYHPATGSESIEQVARFYERDPGLVAQLNRVPVESLPARGTMLYIPPVNDREQVRQVLIRINRDPKSVPTTPWNPRGRTDATGDRGPAERKRADSSTKKSVYRPPIVENPKAGQKTRESGKKTQDSGPGAGPTSTVNYAPPRGDFAWPLRGEVIARFKPGWDHPMHGIEIAAAEGAPVHASRGGKVLLARKYLSYGNLIVIDHGDGYVTNYAYLLKPLVRENETVQRGQQIATVGYPPGSTRSKLFFQIRRNGQPVDPIAFLK